VTGSTCRVSVVKHHGPFGQKISLIRAWAPTAAISDDLELGVLAELQEALRHFGSGTARMIRYEPGGTATLVASEGTTWAHVRVGERWEGYPPAGLTATVLRTRLRTRQAAGSMTTATFRAGSLGLCRVSIDISLSCAVREFRR
jgi:hypothetical protein